MLSLLNEMLIVAAVSTIGASSVAGLLYLFYKKTLTFMLWVRLSPGVCLFSLAMFMWGHLGVCNILASVCAPLVGIIVLVGNFIWMGKKLATPLEHACDGLNEGAEQIASAASQVSSTSQSLAEGSSEQAASIEETSASLEEISSMTKQNADNASQANLLMDEAEKDVNKANVSMRELIKAIGEISQSSDETKKIVKTIDEVAFQTNLLALNAAVEAARAGEAGAGFAVVADEVRNLALRSAEAAKNTAGLVEDTVKKAEHGSELVSVTAEAFEKVAHSAGKVGELVGEIAAASGEQSKGIEEINTTVTEMEKVTQGNAANAEEIAAASEELHAQTEQMNEIVRTLEEVVGSGGNSKETSRKEASRTLTVETVNTASAPEGRPHSGNRRIAAPQKRTAEEIIPLDDHDNFQDF